MSSSRPRSCRCPCWAEWAHILGPLCRKCRRQEKSFWRAERREAGTRSLRANAEGASLARRASEGERADALTVVRAGGFCCCWTLLRPEAERNWLLHPPQPMPCADCFCLGQAVGLVSGSGRALATGFLCSILPTSHASRTVDHRLCTSVVFSCTKSKVSLLSSFCEDDRGLCFPWFCRICPSARQDFSLTAVPLLRAPVLRHLRRRGGVWLPAPPLLLLGLPPQCKFS